MEQSLKRLTILKSHIRPKKTAAVEGKVHYEFKEELRAAIITWDFPATLNALSPETIIPLAEHLMRIEKDDKIGVVILTGVGSTFSAGANISNFGDGSDFTGGVKFEDLKDKEWYRPIISFSKPIIAAVNGYCLGGGMEVALM